MPTALITGGTSGIGAEFARQLAAKGYDLVLVARDVERLEAMAAELPARFGGVQVEVLPADLSDRAQVERVAERLERQDAPIDLLVNNAGFSVKALLTDRDVSAHDRGYEVMMRAVLVLGGAAGRAMRERGRGRIINVASTAAFVTMGSYSAIKAWVVSYSEGLSIELGGTGVTVTALCPGWVHTEFHERAGVSMSKLPDVMWLEAGPLVASALRDSERGKVISIPSVRYKTMIWLARVGPKGAVRRISAKLSSSRRTPTAPAEQAESHL
jgi:short-subunit dehydrogenase